jgi:predicted anti-sigma-YlaC factor YlaD
MTEPPCTWLSDHPEALGEEVRPAHLETCEQCRRQVEGLERVLRHALAPREVPVPPELARRIEEAVEARYGGGRRKRSWAWLLAAVVLGLLLVAAAGGVVIARRPAQDANDPAMATHGLDDAGSHRRSREIPSRGDVSPDPSTRP